jgi:2-isopropylmalate synthase
VRFKELADKKKEIYDEDIILLVDKDAITRNQRIQFDSLQVECGSEGPQVARLQLNIDGRKRMIKMEGNGPVDAIFKAIKALEPNAQECELKLYQVHGVTQGTDAQAEVTVRLEREGTLVTGHGADVDTLVASAKAYIAAINKLERLSARLLLTDQEETAAAKKPAKKSKTDAA